MEKINPTHYGGAGLNTPGERYRGIIAAFFGFGIVAGAVPIFLPHPVPILVVPYAAALTATALAAASALLLPGRFYSRVNYAYVAPVLISGIVWSTGIEQSPVIPLFLFASVTSAAVLQPRAAYAATAVNALMSALPILHGGGFSTFMMRQEVLLVPMMFGLTYVFTRVTRDARYQRRARDIMEAISRIGDLSSNYDLPSVLEALVDALRRVTNSEYVLLYLMEEDGRTLRPVAVDGEPGSPLEEARTLAEWPVTVGEGVTGWVAEHGEPVITGDMETDPRAVYIPGTRRVRVSSIIVPLKAQSKVIGVMRIARHGVNRYSQADLQLVEVVSRQASVAVQNSRLYEESRELYEKTRWLSVTDSLTGLFNQRYLSERLPVEIARAEQYGGNLSLLMVDADTLKQVNDQFGHDLGDRLIKSLADAMRSQIRIGDTAVRYAGDEFVVLLPDANEEQARTVGERIRQTVETIDLGVAAPVAVSIGCATFPSHASNVEDLIKRADAALYHSKRSGKNRLTVYRQAM